MTEHCLTAFFDVNNYQKQTNVLKKLCRVDKCLSQIDLRKCRARQAFVRMYKQCAMSDIVSHPYTIMQIISNYWFLSGKYLHNRLTHSSTYMKKVNDVTGWLSQTTDISKYFVWSPGLWDKESRLYMEIAHSDIIFHYLSLIMRKPVLCHMRTTKVQISLRIHAVWSAPLLFTA